MTFDSSKIESHLLYEIGQLRNAADLLRAKLKDHQAGKLLPGEWAAFVESFVTHARCLVQVLYLPKSTSRKFAKADVQAFDFLPRGVWPIDRSASLPVVLQPVFRRASQQVEHLTMDRTNFAAADYEWDIDGIEAELTAEFNRFLALATQHGNKRLPTPPKAPTAIPSSGTRVSTPGSINPYGKTH